MHAINSREEPVRDGELVHADRAFSVECTGRHPHKPTRPREAKSPLNFDEVWHN